MSTKLQPNREMAKAIFEAIIDGGEKDLTDEERQELVVALNGVVARWRSRPRVPSGPDVGGYWIHGASNATKFS